MRRWIYLDRFAIRNRRTGVGSTPKRRRTSRLIVRSVSDGPVEFDCLEAMVFERTHHVVPGAVGVLFLDLRYQTGDVTEYFPAAGSLGIRTRRIFDLSTAGGSSDRCHANFLSADWGVARFVATVIQGAIPVCVRQFDRVAVRVFDERDDRCTRSSIGPASRSILPPRARISAAAW